MLSIGFPEIIMIAVLGLLVFGPERLPEAIRTIVTFFTKAKHTWNNTRRDLEKELGMDEIRREIHNAQMLENLEAIKNTANETKNQIANTLNGSAEEFHEGEYEHDDDLDPDGDYSGDHSGEYDHDDEYGHQDEHYDVDDDGMSEPNSHTDKQEKPEG